MNRTVYISIFLILSICSAAFTQQVQFSQYYSASLHLNPAIAGIYQEPSFHISYRQQVSDRSNEGVVNNLSQASIILPVKKKGRMKKMLGGFGAMVYNNSAGLEGVFTTNGAFINYAQNIYIGALEGETIIVGAQIGYEQTSLAFSKLIWGSQYSPFVGTDPTKPAPVTEFDGQVGYPVINLGAMYYFNKERNFLLYRYSAFSGFVVTNINRPNTALVSSGPESRQKLLYKYHGGFEFKLSKFDFMPSILGTIQNGIFQFNGGGTVAYSLKKMKRYTVSNRGLKLAGGAWYRLRDSFIVYLGFRSPIFNAGISYDMNTKVFFDSGNLFQTQPSVELSMQYFLYKGGRIRRVANPLF